MTKKQKERSMKSKAELPPYASMNTRVQHKLNTNAANSTLKVYRMAVLFLRFLEYILFFTSKKSSRLRRAFLVVNKSMIYEISNILPRSDFFYHNSYKFRFLSYLVSTLFSTVIQVGGGGGEEKY